MSVETSHILQRLPSYREIALVEKTVPVLEAGRYFKRWAHRLREHGLMTANLPPPHDNAQLARVCHPAELWVEIVELYNQA